MIISNFPHPRARATAFFLAHTKEVSFSVIENIVVNCPSFLLFSPTTQKSRRAEEKFHNVRSLQENNARSAANQSARTIVAI